MGGCLLCDFVLGGFGSLGSSQKFLGGADYITGTPDVEGVDGDQGKNYEDKFHFGFGF